MQNQNVRPWHGTVAHLLFPWVPCPNPLWQRASPKDLHPLCTDVTGAGIGVGWEALFELPTKLTMVLLACGRDGHWLVPPPDQPLFVPFPPISCSQAPQRRWREGTEQGLETWWLSPSVEACFTECRAVGSQLGQGRREQGWTWGVGVRGLGRRPKPVTELGRWQEAGPCVNWGSKPLPSPTLHCPIRHHLQNTNSKTQLLRISRWWLQSIKPQGQGPFWASSPAQLHRLQAHESGPAWGTVLQCWQWTRQGRVLIEENGN